MSYHFFKQYCKKEIGKENNYIFNYKDNFLNDMSKIDKEFFEDYYSNRCEEVFSGNLLNKKNTLSSNFENRELVFEFAIYHPLKNTKTQQISILGSSYLFDLKDKIYCVLDEIYNINQTSFFFIENVFYNDTRYGTLKLLSNNILDNKIRKLDITSFKTLAEEDVLKGKIKEENKFPYNKKLYSNFEGGEEIYDECSMSDKTISEIPFRIGYPYLYRHVDYCDHMILLIDIRFLDKYDKITDENKCLVTYQKKLKRRICDACEFYYAKIISINDRIGGNDNKVIFLCDQCLKKLHEKEYKEGTSNTLKLIPYFHD
jgi:hypothetical protein